MPSRSASSIRGTLAYAADRRTGTLEIWDVSTGELKSKVAGLQISELVADPTANRFAYRYFAGPITLIDGDGKKLWETSEHKLAVESSAGKMAFSPDGKHLVYAITKPAKSPAYDVAIVRYNAATGEEVDRVAVETKQGFGTQVAGIMYSADGKVIVFGDGQATHRMDASTLKELGSTPRGFPAITPDGRAGLAIYSGNLVRTDLETGKADAPVPLDVSAQTTLAVLPGGRLLVGGTNRAAVFEVPGLDAGKK